MTSPMAARGDHDRTGVEMQRFKGAVIKELAEDNTTAFSYKGYRQNKNGKLEVDSDGSDVGGGVVSFSTNHNSVVCLPLVSEGLKLVWTQSDQTRELDGIPELVQAFNVFPYPTSQEVAFLARRCTLPLDKVKVWFMVQRIKYGISWASEEIEETRCKLAGPERGEPGEEADQGEHETEHRVNGCRELGVVAEREGAKDIDAPPVSQPSPPKRTKHEDAGKPPAISHFRSSLPPPQDSYYYRHPVDAPALPLSSLEPSPGSQRRHGRYKKSKAQLAVLRSSFLRENWPAEAELRRLQEETGLSRNDIRKWFSDSRYQLRNGRGGPGVAQAIAHSHEGNGHQLQPLPLVAHGPRHPQGGGRSGSRGKGARSSRSGDSSFFQNFLSTSLEAVGEGGVTLKADPEEQEPMSAEGPKEQLKDETEEDESEEEQPLQLVNEHREPKTREPLVAAPSSPTRSRSRSPSPATAALPHKRSAPGGSLHKPTRSVKSSPSPGTPSLSSPPPSTTSTSSSSSCSSPVLTAAGRPRKTKEQLDVLKQHFLKCQWPKSEDYTKLVELTGLPRADVIQWFGDTRYAVKNGQLRWVRGVRDQFMAELALQQNGGIGGGAGGTPRLGGRRRKLEENGGPVAPHGGDVADSHHDAGGGGNSGMDIRPLEIYRRHTGALQEKDLDALCRKSRMSYQQVRDWFACQENGMSDSEVNVTD